MTIEKVPFKRNLFYDPKKFPQRVVEGLHILTCEI